MTTPGQRIRQRRIELGFKHQGKFAKMLGCSQATLSEIETGETALPSAKVMAKMCEVLKTTDRWIIFGEDGDVSLPTKEESQLLSAFRAMSAEQQASMLMLITAIPKK